MTSKVEAVAEKLNVGGNVSKILASRGTEVVGDKVISLDLSGLEIREIPGGTFDNLTDLDRLYLNYNELTSVDAKSFSALEKLTFLSFFANKITEFPDDFFTGFPNLEWLDLRENGLKKVPSSVVDLKKLKYLFFQNNPDLTTDKYDFSEDYHSKRDVGKFVEQFQKATGVTPKETPATKATKKTTKKTTTKTEEPKAEETEEKSEE